MLSDDGRVLAEISSERVRTWSVADWRLLSEWTAPVASRFEGVAVSADGTHVVVGLADGRAVRFTQQIGSLPPAVQLECGPKGRKAQGLCGASRPSEQ